MAAVSWRVYWPSIVGVHFPLFGPWFLVGDHLVEDDEQLSGDGDEGDLGGFSGLPHGGVFGLEARVGAACDEGRHVERGAHAGPPAGYRGAASVDPALLDVGRQSGEARCG